MEALGTEVPQAWIVKVPSHIGMHGADAMTQEQQALDEANGEMDLSLPDDSELETPEDELFEMSLQSELACDFQAFLTDDDDDGNIDEAKTSYAITPDSKLKGQLDSFVAWRTGDCDFASTESHSLLLVQRSSTPRETLDGFKRSQYTL